MLFTSICHCLLVHCRQYGGVLCCLLPYVIVYLSTVGSTEVSYVGVEELTVTYTGGETVTVRLFQGALSALILLPPSYRSKYLLYAILYTFISDCYTLYSTPL